MINSAVETKEGGKLDNFNAVCVFLACRSVLHAFIFMRMREAGLVVSYLCVSLCVIISVDLCSTHFNVTHAKGWALTISCSVVFKVSELI